MRTTNGITTAIAALAGFLLVLLSMTDTASANEFQPTTMRFDRLSVADGLSQSSVMAMVQDDSGFLWFATESGLDRYDGFTFRHYRHQRGNPNALASDFIRDLDLAADGSLWIATDGGGVSRWNPATDSITTFRYVADDPTSLASDRVRTIVAGDDGTVWIGTRDAGLDRLDLTTNIVQHFVHESGNDASSTAKPWFCEVISTRPFCKFNTG